MTIENNKERIKLRLWHYKLINKLPRQQLLGQHRECCALRGKGWGKKHSTVNYIFSYDKEKLVAYHYMIMEEMLNRGYNIEEKWLDITYRGKILGYDNTILGNLKDYSGIYFEHNISYMRECIDNLKNKGITLAK